MVTCALTQNLSAVNRNERFINPAISWDPRDAISKRLSERELESVKLVSDYLSNNVVGEVATGVRQAMMAG